MANGNQHQDDDFFRAIDEIAVVLANAFDVTIFGKGPGTMAPLPKALGDSQSIASVSKAVHYKEGFFAILEAKARFLKLPIILPRVFLRSSVPVTWAVPIEGAAGQVTFSNYAPTGVYFKTSIEQQLPQLGTNLGRSVPPLTKMADDIGTIYHELVHFWIGNGQLEETWLNLLNDGRQAMAGAITLEGTDVDAATAFTESAAYQVDRRISSWLTALDELNKLLNPLSVDDGAEAFSVGILGDIAAAYDKTIDTPGPVWIHVQASTKPNKFEQLAMPLPLSIQRRIDEVLLEDLPLSKHFADTPLSAIAGAVDFLH
jgi:hypothetical protein